MAFQLSRQRVIDREVLWEVGDARLEEAKILLESKHYAGSVYLGGYAVECYLKVAICKTLGWDALRGMFKTHDLEGLMLYSGFHASYQGNSRIRESFAKVLELWSAEGFGNVRYRRPTEVDQETAEMFLKCVDDPEVGIVSWLKRTISE